MTNADELAFVVTGCGRSGTKYMARLLAAVGVRCTHEALFTPKTRKAPPVIDGDSSWMAVPFLDELPADTAILHLVRDPLQVTRSFLDLGFFSTAYDEACAERLPIRFVRRRPPSEAYIRFLRRHSPKTFSFETAQLRAEYHWVDWNSRVVSAYNCRPHMRIRLEELDESKLNDVLVFLRVEVTQGAVQRAFDEVPRNTNSRPRGERGEDLAARGLITQTAMSLGASYGYETG